MDIKLAKQEAGELCHSRDLLQRFAGTISEERIPPYRKLEDAADYGDVSIELGLGLSLGGCFEVAPTNKRLMRSSSTAMIAVFPTEIDFSLSSVPLVRSCSLPVEADEEHLKRKEMQGLKRMEVKRKRLEKRSGSRPPEAVGCGNRKEEVLIAETNGCVPVGWAMTAAGGDGREVRTEHPESIWSSRLGFNGRELPGKRHSRDTKDHLVSGPKDLDSSNSSVPPSTLPAGQKSASRAPLPPPLRSLKSLQEEEQDEVLKPSLNGSKDAGRNIMAEMPFVSTRGGGPNGRRVEGFLYRYRRGEEVRIVCICHGSFHTPAEFVKHAGGGDDVPHPLRQIVVNPSPPFYY